MFYELHYEVNTCQSMIVQHVLPLDVVGLWFVRKIIIFHSWNPFGCVAIFMYKSKLRTTVK